MAEAAGYFATTDLAPELIEHEDFPPEIAAKLAARDEAAVTVDEARERCRTLMREARDEAEAEAAKLSEGVAPQYGAAEARTARIAAADRAETLAVSRHEAAVARYAAACETHRPELAALAREVAAATHEELGRLGEAFERALKAREQAFVLAGSPGVHERVQTADGVWTAAHWTGRPNLAPRFTTDGIETPTLDGVLRQVRDVVSGFPVDAVVTNAEGEK